jgi:diguanylate cyclase (GGDEF)-like protein
MGTPRGMPCCGKWRCGSSNKFAIALPESGPENSRKFAEKVCRLIADQPFEFEGQKFSVTISVGVAELSGQMSEPIALIKIADANLYKAKKAGRNRVAC